MLGVKKRMQSHAAICYRKDVSIIDDNTITFKGRWWSLAPYINCLLLLNCQHVEFIVASIKPLPSITSNNPINNGHAGVSYMKVQNHPSARILTAMAGFLEHS